MKQKFECRKNSKIACEKISLLIISYIKAFDSEQEKT